MSPTLASRASSPSSRTRSPPSDGEAAIVSSVAAPASARPQVVVATRSEHKLRELRQLLHPAIAELVSLDDIGVEGDVEETGATFEANARLKARTYARLTNLPTLADDSG